MSAYDSSLYRLAAKLDEEREPLWRCRSCHFTVVAFDRPQCPDHPFDEMEEQR